MSYSINPDGPDNNDSLQQDSQPDETSQRDIKSGANWFYWIAALSLLNSLIITFGGNLNFILGLGITQIIDGLAFAFVENGAPSAIKFVALAANIVVASIFVGFGYFAGKGAAWAFIVGIVIYVLDGLIYFMFGEMLAAGFHVFALIWIVRSFLASRSA